MTTFRRDLLLVFALAFVLRLLAALPQTQPNYMDAAYYTVGGQRLAQGYGFSDPYVWHYLDQPQAVPQPSHLYWMPLPSMLVAASQLLLGVNYRAAQAPFVLLSALLPVIAYAVAWQLSANRRHAWLAALLMIFSAFYVPYWGVPESFTPFAVFGALALWLGSRQGDRETSRKGTMVTLAAGACAGLAHLSRADGFLLLLPIVLGAFNFTRHSSLVTRHTLRWTALAALGYLLIMTPWFLRNLAVIGAPLSSAGTQAAWLCNYDELFSYGVRFDVNHLLSCGLDQVLLMKITGVASGVVHLIAESGLIFMAWPIAIGLWQSRRHTFIRSALIYLSAVFFVMTMVFTFAGDRGGLFHSAGALLPFFYAAAPIGMDSLIRWIAARRRTWRVRPAQVVFTFAAIGLALGLSGFVYRGRVIGANLNDPIWNRPDEAYGAIERALIDRGVVDPIVMVNNPPLFTYHTGLRSIVIPNGDVTSLLAAARQFEVRWVVLDANRPAALADVYARPEAAAGLRLAASFGDSYLLEIAPP